MRSLIPRRPAGATSILTAFALLSPFASATSVIESESLATCQDHSGIAAQFFNVVFTPNNNTIFINIAGDSTINSYVSATIDVTAYGYSFYSKVGLDPCSKDINIEGLCPMTTGPLDIRYNLRVDPDTVKQIPSIAYGIPDLDGQVNVKIFQYNRDTQVSGKQLACVSADLSNGKTVYQLGVGWASAVVAGLALLASALAAGLGHSNTATHVAANAMSLFAFFQTQAIFGLTAVPLPPIVQSWTQNFQWSMGIIHVHFIQRIASWYQQSTGGSPSTILSSLGQVSVNVQKRSLELAARVYTRAEEYGMGPLMDHLLSKRQTTTGNTESVTVKGIERVGFRAGIEPTNIFMTGYIFFAIFVVFVCLGVVAFRYILEALASSGKMKSDKFQDFRNGWTTVLRGILFRLVLIGFPQMTILCFWELVHQDSAGCEALAVITILTIIVMLVWACAKVWRLAKRSISMHKNPAYILYSDPVCLHKWGFLYVQFKATAYWFIMPSLVYTLAICLFVAFAQGSGTAQAVGILVLNLAFLVGVSILRPFMDKKTNAFNISIASVNFVSSIFLLFFTDVFGLPGLVVGVMGVIFFILNAAFALILLIMVLLATGFAIFSKNPDVRYQPMRDDRGSFIKSASQLNTELDALGATARGETKSPFKREIDSDSYEGSLDERPLNGGYNSMTPPYVHRDSQRSATTYDSSPFRTTSMTSAISHQPPARVASPWQRGAGYDH